MKYKEVDWEENLYEKIVSEDFTKLQTCGSIISAVGFDITFTESSRCRIFFSFEKIEFLTCHAILRTPATISSLSTPVNHRTIHYQTTRGHNNLAIWSLVNATPKHTRSDACRRRWPRNTGGNNALPCDCTPWIAQALPSRRSANLSKEAELLTSSFSRRVLPRVVTGALPSPARGGRGSEGGRLGVDLDTTAAPGLLSRETIWGCPGSHSGVPGLCLPSDSFRPKGRSEFSCRLIRLMILFVGYMVSWIGDPNKTGLEKVTTLLQK